MHGNKNAATVVAEMRVARHNRFSTGGSFVGIYFMNNYCVKNGMERFCSGWARSFFGAPIQPGCRDSGAFIAIEGHIVAAIADPDSERNAGALTQTRLLFEAEIVTSTWSWYAVPSA